MKKFGMFVIDFTFLFYFIVFAVFFVSDVIGFSYLSREFGIFLSSVYMYGVFVALASSFLGMIFFSESRYKWYVGGSVFMSAIVFASVMVIYRGGI